MGSSGTGVRSSLSSSGQTTSYAYDAAGNLVQTTLPSGNGYVEARAYDRAGRLVEVEWKKGTNVLAKFASTLDPVGNPLQIVRTGSLAETQTFAYDANDRLIGVCFQAGMCPGASDPFIRYTYDLVGNRLTEQRPGLATTSYSYDARDRLLSAGSTSYTYDLNGNQLTAGSRTFAYDLANRLKSTTQGSTTTTYGYDGDGLRQQAATGTQAAKKTSFLWDPSFGLPQLAQERDGSGALLRRYTYGIHRISMTSGNTTSYYLRDSLGSTANLTSASGQTQWTYSYEPFGQVRTETKASGNQPENLMRFTGEYLDPTGLYHLRARQYDPKLGRFLTRDPADQTVNESLVSAYAYVANRPTVYVDPSGEVLAPSNRAKTSTRVASGLTTGVSTSPSGGSLRRADGCVRRVSGSSGYERYSASFPAARLLPFPFHASLSIDAFPTTCRGSRWTVHWWTRVDTSALVGPFGEFWLTTSAAIRGDAGGWRTLGTHWWRGGLNPSRDYWDTYRERYAFISVNPPRQFEQGRLTLAVRRDQELGIFPGLLPTLQKRVEFPLGTR